MIGELEEGETREASGEDELTWPMLANGACSTASPVAKRDITPKIALNAREEEKQKLKPTSLTSIQKKVCYMKEVKLKEVEWPWSKQKWMQCLSTKDRNSSKN
jgi:hypothetical protein